MNKEQLSPELLRQLARALNLSDDALEETADANRLLRVHYGSLDSLDDIDKLTDIPPEAREQIKAALQAGQTKGVISIPAALCPPQLDALMHDAIRALNFYSENQEDAAAAAAALVLLEHNIAARKAVVLKALLEGDGLGRNAEEREINIQHAIYTDAELTELLNRAARLRAELQGAERYVETHARIAHHALAMCQVLTRHELALKSSSLQDTLDDVE